MTPPKATLPPRVRVVEVGPRDGLQDEPEIVPLETKLEFIADLTAAGLATIEVGAFVRPDRVPQMADTDEVVARLDLGGEPSYVALVPNEKGLDRALAAGVRHIAFFTAASEAFAEANIGMPIDDSLRRFDAMIKRARAEGMTVRGYVSTGWWCPFSGRVPPSSVARVAQALMASGCDEISIADTIGAATPVEVEEVLAVVLPDIDVDRVAVHFHETRGTALANVHVALQHGITVVDASAGGLGGCPFAPGAPGNVATEDLIYMLHGLGVETGVDLEGVRRASLKLQRVLGRVLPSRYLQAGPVKVKPS